MEKCVPHLAAGEVEETITSAASPSSTSAETSRFHSTFEECLSSLDAISLGDLNGARSSLEPKTEYFSARVELMMRTQDQFPSVAEYEIAHSKVHWSEVSDRLNLTDDTDDTDCDSNSVDLEYEAEVNRENKHVYDELLNDPEWNHPEYGPFFRKWRPHLHLGHKIAEGGQAEIYDIMWSNNDAYAGSLVKVFKRSSHLSDLHDNRSCYTTFELQTFFQNENKE